MFYFDDTNKGWNDYHLPKPSQKTKNKPYKTHDITFPSFGKCASLRNFPIAFISCVNSGDLNSLSKLMNSRMSKCCEIEVMGCSMDKETFVGYYDLNNELYPDCVSYVHRTICVGNRISGIIYFKYTTSKIIDVALRKNRQDKTLFNVCPPLHSNPHSLNAFIASQPVEDRPALLTMVYTAEELVVSGHAVMTITYDERTKKITRLEIKCEASEFRVVETPPPPTPPVPMKTESVNV